MQHALKLALVDPKDVAYKNLNKNPDGVLKAGMTIKLNDILADSTIPDDLKLKLYNQTLSRLMKVGEVGEEQTSAINWVSAAAPQAPTVHVQPPVVTSVGADVGAIPINYTTSQWHPSTSDVIKPVHTKKRKITKTRRADGKRQPKSKKYDPNNWVEY